MMRRRGRLRRVPRRVGEKGRNVVRDLYSAYDLSLDELQPEAVKQDCRTPSSFAQRKAGGASS